MALSNESMTENNSFARNKVLHTGERTRYPSRPTGVNYNSSNSSEDEMGYGRIVKIIEATTKNKGR